MSWIYRVLPFSFEIIFFYVWKFPYLLLITVFWPWHPNMYNNVNILNSKCMYVTIVVAAIQKHVMDNVRVLYHGFRGDEMVIAICAKVKGHAIIICLHGRNSCIGKCQCLKNGICPKEQIKYFYFTTIVANRIQSLWPRMIFNSFMGKNGLGTFPFIAISKLTKSLAE